MSRIASLLVVQKGRVDRAIALVHERNAALRERELERDGARQRVTNAVAAYRAEQARLSESINTASAPAGVRAVGLTTASVCCDAHRKRMTEATEELAGAEEKVTSASAAAVEARTAYRRALARQDALSTLQAGCRKAQAVKALRLEEQDA
jgi:hypothetical protein